MRNMLFLSIVLFSWSNIYAQKKIKLTNSVRTRVLKEGIRVGYIIKSDVIVTKGILKTIDKSFIVVGDETIEIKNLDAIGRRRSGSGLFRFLCVFFGSAFIIDAVSPANNTPSCGGCQ